jgi:hypothetical protein
LTPRGARAQHGAGQRGTTTVNDSQNKGLLAFLLVLGFFWLVFDNLALGLIFGFIAVGIVAQRDRKANEGE